MLENYTDAQDLTTQSALVIHFIPSPFYCDFTSSVSRDSPFQDRQRLAIMSSVWVQLYYKGKDEPEGEPIFIKMASLDPPVIAALKREVKKEMAEELTHCSAAKLVVDSPDT